MGCIFEISLKYCSCFLSEPLKIFSLWFSYHHFLCIIYCMIRSDISSIEISLSFMVTWAYDCKTNVFSQTIISSCKVHLMFLHAKPSWSHDKGIDCVFVLLFSHRDIDSALKLFLHLVKSMHDAAVKSGSHKAIMNPFKSEPPKGHSKHYFQENI